MRPEQVLEWLVRHQPRRPPELAARMDRAVCEMNSDVLAAAPAMADALANLGLALLRNVTCDSEDTSATPEELDLMALELLAADAFVTYAFEAAAEDRGDVGPLVARLLREAA